MPGFYCHLRHFLPSTGTFHRSQVETPWTPLQFRGFIVTPAQAPHLISAMSSMRPPFPLYTLEARMPSLEPATHSRSSSDPYTATTCALADKTHRYRFRPPRDPGTGHFCPRQHTDSRLTVIAYLPVRARAVNEQRDSPHSEQLQSNRLLPPGKGAPSATATSALPFLFHNPLRHPASQSAGQTGDRQLISEQGAGPVSFRKEPHGFRDN